MSDEFEDTLTDRVSEAIEFCVDYGSPPHSINDSRGWEERRYQRSGSPRL